VKIVILQGAFLPVPPLMGGAVEKMWFILGQKFSARGHQVTHISRRFKHLPTKDLIDNVQHIRVAGYETPSSLILLKLLDAIYTIRAMQAVPKDADIVVTNTFWAPIFLPLVTRAKVYVDVARMPKGQMCFYQKAHLRANSNPVATAIRAELPSALHHQVSMVPNPLPYQATIIEQLNYSDFSNKKHVILFCGRVHPEKGIELLTETIQALPDDWILKIVGPYKIAEGGGGEEYLRLLKRIFNSPKVQFIEPIYDVNKLNLLYKEASIFVYPSIAEKGETFGLAPLEAMAWSAVPVVSDLNCFKDFIFHGKNGLIFDHSSEGAGGQLKECVLDLIHNHQKLVQLANEASKVNISHSPDNIADLFIADFKRLLA
jgi:glycosyltransferase involved in cell wall biosynthesis